MRKTGSEPAEKHRDEIGKGRVTRKYTDTGECHDSHVEKRHGIRELSRIYVRFHPLPLLLRTQAPISLFYQPTPPLTNPCFLRNRANENAASSGRKTISPQDVLKALDELEFGDFKPRLEAELASSPPLPPYLKNSMGRK